MRVRAALTVLLSLLMLGSLTRRGWAAWPHDPNNGNVPLCTAANDQASPTIVSDGAGGAIVTWQDGRSGSYDIYAQRVNAAGVPLWTANGVALCTAADDQFYPTIVSDGAGGAIVTWYDFRSGTGYHIYAQRVSAAGVPLWTADGVALCAAAGDHQYPQIVSDGAGGAIVTWEDYRSTTTGPKIYAQRVSAAGVPLWTTDGVALCTAAGGQTGPQIASDGAGGAIVTWTDGRDMPPLIPHIYAQRVNAAGVPQWAADGVGLCTVPFGGQGSPSIVSDGAGGAYVSWDDFRSGVGPSADIYAQRVGPTGVTQWHADGVALCTAANDQLYPTVALDGANGLIVTWEDDRSGTSGNTNIYAQRVAKDGLVQWTADGVAVCTAPNRQNNPTIVSDGAGGAIITWEDNRSGTISSTNYDIYAQRLNAAGVPQCVADGMRVCTAVGDQIGPTLVADGAGGAIITWVDNRSGTVSSTNYDIYAQDINADCKLGGVVSVPALPIAANFALSRVQPNPSVGELSVSFSLPDDTPASLEVYDLTGRRIESQLLGGLGAGAHSVSLIPRGSRWAPGIYEVRLKQGSRSAFLKVAIVR